MIVSGHDVAWCSQDRSEETISQARRMNLREFSALGDLATFSEFIFCVGSGSCGPLTAEQLILSGYAGTLVDLNSLWGEKSEEDFRYLVSRGNFSYVEGAMRGYPYDVFSGVPAGERIVLLSGAASVRVGELFAGGTWLPLICVEPAKSVNRKLSDRQTTV